MSRGTANDILHTYLARLLKEPVFQHEFSGIDQKGKVPYRIREINKVLPDGWKVVGRWVNFPTMLGPIRERLYELRRP